MCGNICGKSFQRRNRIFHNKTLIWLMIESNISSNLLKNMNINYGGKLMKNIDNEIEEVVINTEFIKLDQLLKWANFTGSGVEAKMFIQNGEVKVNNAVETRRGKKIYDGDVVEFAGEKVVVRATH